MRITVNGDPMEVAAQVTVTDLLSQLKIKPELVVVELNLNILKRQDLASTPLKENDQVEIVRIVGGGGTWYQKPFWYQVPRTSKGTWYRKPLWYQVPFRGAS